MADKRAEEIWADLLSDDSHESDERHEFGPLPNLDQRVELLLRAIHGPSRDFTSDERRLARQRLLDEIADGLIDPAPIRQSRSAEAETSVDAAARRDEAQPSRRSPAEPAAGLGDALLTAIRRFGHDLLYPFTGGTLQSTSGLRYAAAPLALLLLVGSGWSGAWFYAASNAEARLAAASPAMSEVAGYSCASRRKSGFPFSIELHCAAPTVTVAANDRTLTIRAKELVATSSIFGSDRLRGEVVGPVTITEQGRAIAVADGDLAFDQHGQFDGDLKFTSTPANLQSLAAALGHGDAPTLERLDQLAQASLRPAPNDVDAAGAAGGGDEPDFAGQPVLDVPLSIKNGTIALGAVNVGRLSPLFKR